MNELDDIRDFNCLYSKLEVCLDDGRISARIMFF
jgi:hypothetical protein